MPAQTTHSPSTVERHLDEVEEWSDRVRKIRQKMNRARRGSEPYLDHLPELEVELRWLEQKAKHAAEAVDTFLESLPDDA
jgi:hypothetical protein